MKPVTQLSLLLALLLLSFGIKFALTPERGPRNDLAFVQTVAARLGAVGFAAEVERRPKGLAVAASRGSCRMLVRSGDNNSGARTALYRLAGRPYGVLRYVYRGRESVTIPRWRPLLDRIAARRPAIFGVRRNSPAVIAVAASAACGPPARFFRGL